MQDISADFSCLFLGELEALGERAGLCVCMYGPRCMIRTSILHGHESTLKIFDTNVDTFQSWNFVNDIDPAYELSKCSHTTCLPFCSRSFRFCLIAAKRAFLQTQTNVTMNKPISGWASDCKSLMPKLLSPFSDALLSVLFLHVCLCNLDGFAMCSVKCEQYHDWA